MNASTCLLPAMIAIACTSCGGESGSTENPAIPAEALSTLPHPENRRAKAASKRVRPELEAALYEKDLRFGDPVFLRAFKQERILEVFVKNRETGTFQLFRTYPIAAASGTLGPKHSEGDGQVPEGFYFVRPAAMNPRSRFHLSFDIGYPNAYDRHHQRTGSFIMIHGGRASVGCLAMTDPAIEEIYTLCDAAHRGGQSFFRVHIFPFRLTPETLESHRNHPQHAFWNNLRDGYDWFEKHAVPPDTRVSPDGTYQFQTAR